MRMFQRLRTLLHDVAASTTDGDGAQPTPEVAAAALLIEAASADGDFDADERAAIAATLQRHFGLAPDEVGALMAQAQRAQGEQAQLVRFTQTLKQRYSEAERTEIIEMLWEVAYADGALHAYEDNLLRRIGGLLYVSDRDRGEARKRVLERLRHTTGRTTD